MQVFDRSSTSTLIPQQPYLRAQSAYQERLICGNPFSRKNSALCYQFETGDEQGVLFIPDGCVNFLFRCDADKPSALVSGIYTHAHEKILEPHALYFGFKPYSCSGFKTAHSAWAELVEQTIPLHDVVQPANQILEKLSLASTFLERVESIRLFSFEHMVDPENVSDLVEFAEERLCRTHGSIRIDEIGRYSYYSHRYCRELFKKVCGISQKSYASIMRFQNTVRLLSADGPNKELDLADIVFANGYFDQSHLIREFRRFADSTPGAFFRAQMKCLDGQDLSRSVFS